MGGSALRAGPILDVALVLAFIAYGVTAGFLAKRRASRGLTAYFLAGRTVKGRRAGVSMAATQYAADTPLLVAGLLALGGVFSLWRLWIYGLAFLLMGYLLGACWLRAGVLTDAELVEKRYFGPDVDALRVLKAVYYGTITNCVVMAFVLVAAVRIFEIFLPWHLWLLVAAIERLRAAARGIRRERHRPVVGRRRPERSGGEDKQRNQHRLDARVRRPVLGDWRLAQRY